MTTPVVTDSTSLHPSSDDPVKAAYAELVRAAAAGDTDAMERLLMRAQEVAYRFSLLVCGHPEDAEDVVNNNRMRSALQAAQAAAQLLSPDLAVRREAVAALGKQTLEMTQLPLIDKALSAEKDPELQEVLGRMKASILVAAPDKAQRLEAVRLLGASGRTQVKSLLQERLAPGAETDPEVRGALLASLDKVSARLAWGERLGVLFTGLSLGSILLLVALGLAITYGLMGVINMAHGELMMIGAYATYMVQNLFKAHAPGAFDWYLAVAVPVMAVFVSLVVGHGVAEGADALRYTLFSQTGMNQDIRYSDRKTEDARNFCNKIWQSYKFVAQYFAMITYNEA